jgi:death-on-curing protein
VIFLSTENIFDIHEHQIQLYGGHPGHCFDCVGKVESILAQQYSFYGYEKYPTLYLKAAMLMLFLVKDHCFTDGNKRVGIAAAMTLLLLNGCESYLDDIDGYNKTIEIAKRRFKNDSRDEYIIKLADWLKERFY